MSTAELIELIGQEDYQIHRQFIKAEENLAQVNEHFKAVAEALDGQVFWNNTAKVSEDMFRDFFNMSMEIQSGINDLTALIEQAKEAERQ